MTDERVVAHTGGEKGTKLARFDLIPSGVEEALAEHFGKGARKYEDRNWERGYQWSLSYAALRRHLAAFWRGEDIDEDGHRHIDAVLWHAVALVHFTQHEKYAEFDNRPTQISEQMQLALEPVLDSIEPTPDSYWTDRGLAAPILDELTHEAEDLGLYGPWKEYTGKPIEEIQRSAMRRFDQHTIREDEWQGAATKRYKGTENPIAHDGTPVYRDNGQLPYSRPNTLKPTIDVGYSELRDRVDETVKDVQSKIVKDIQSKVWGETDSEMLTRFERKAKNIVDL